MFMMMMMMMIVIIIIMQQFCNSMFADFFSSLSWALLNKLTHFSLDNK